MLESTSGFWKMVSASFVSVAALAAFGWYVWQGTDAYYSRRMSLLIQEHEAEQKTLIRERDALRADVQELRARYQSLQSKTEGLFEPYIVFADTLRASDNMMSYFGGDIGFSIETSYLGGILPKPNAYSEAMVIDYWNSKDSVKRYGIELRSGEQWEFQVGKKSYYVTFDILDPIIQTVIGRIYELRPLYRPKK